MRDSRGLILEMTEAVEHVESGVDRWAASASRHVSRSDNAGHSPLSEPCPCVRDGYPIDVKAIDLISIASEPDK